MHSPSKKIPVATFVAAIVALTALAGAGSAAAQSAPAGQDAAAQASTPTPNSLSVVAATPEAIKLLKIMDANSDGKISHAEFIAFMEAEFKRLDLDKDGYLNLKELEKSQLAVAHHGGTRR